MKIPFLGRGGPKEAPVEVQSLPVKKPNEDPDASVVSYYASGSEPIEDDPVTGKPGIRTQLTKQRSDNPESVDPLISRIEKARDLARQKTGSSG